MRILLITLALISIFYLAASQQPGDPDPVSPFYSNPTTQLKLPNGNCPQQCVRRSASDWTEADWQLYSQLWFEANNRGYIGQLANEHNLDCSTPLRGGVNGGCLFHFSQNLLPWHRLFTLHYEQLLQMIDNDINPGRAARDGPFCIAYFNWGFGDTFFSNNPADYTKIFNGNAIGTLINGPIPDGAWANIAVEGTQITRGPTPATNQWSNAVIASCFNSTDIECNGNSQCGFRPCIEYLPHNAFHNSVGQNFASYFAPADPLFFMHHAMVDYMFYLWIQNRGTSVPPGWDHAMVRPYDHYGLSLSSTFSAAQYCYSYAGQGAGSSTPAKVPVPQPFAQTKGAPAPQFNPPSDVPDVIPVTPQPSSITPPIVPKGSPPGPTPPGGTPPGPTPPGGTPPGGTPPGGTPPGPTPPGGTPPGPGGNPSIASFFTGPPPPGGAPPPPGGAPPGPAPPMESLSPKQSGSVLQTIQQTVMPQPIAMEDFKFLNRMDNQITKMQIYYKYLQAVWNAQIVWLVINENYNPEPFGLSYQQIPGYNKGQETVHAYLEIFDWE